MPKTPEQKIAELEATKARIAARIAAQKAKLRKEERKTDTRRKVIVGAAVLAHMEHDPAFRDVVEIVLKNRLTRPADREFLEKVGLGLEVKERRRVPANTDPRAGFTATVSKA